MASISTAPKIESRTNIEQRVARRAKAGKLGFGPQVGIEVVK